MQYFKNFRKTLYTYGDDFEKLGGGNRQMEYVRDLTLYVDVVDQVRESLQYYEPYSIIEGERPDQVSQFLYDTPIYHWTFFMMNDKLREQGWPLTNSQIEEKIAIDYPHQYIRFQADLSNVFLEGEYAYGVISGSRGEIIRRHLDTGTIIVDSEDAFIQGEAVSCSGPAQNVARLANIGTGYEYYATHHYENSLGEYVDIDPTSPVPGVYNEVTFYDRYIRENDKLKNISVIKPENITQIASAYKRALTS